MLAARLNSAGVVASLSSRPAVASGVPAVELSKVIGVLISFDLTDGPKPNVELLNKWLRGGGVGVNQFSAELSKITDQTMLKYGIDRAYTVVRGGMYSFEVFSKDERAVWDSENAQWIRS